MPEIRAMAARVKAYRKIKEKTQFEMAVESGISMETLSLIERERANPSLETMQKISAYMGIPVSELLNVDGEDEKYE